jgi:hypothetical protein
MSPFGLSLNVGRLGTDVLMDKAREKIAYRALEWHHKTPELLCSWFVGDAI